MSKKKHFFIIIICIIIVCGLTGCKSHSAYTQEAFNHIVLFWPHLECGEELPKDIEVYVSSFDLEWYEEATLDLRAVDPDEPGTYPVYIRHGERNYKTYVIIADTLPPEVTVNEDCTAYTNITIDVNELIETEDVSGVKRSRIMSKNPDYFYETEPGTKEYTVKVCDAYDNTEEVSVEIEFADAKTLLNKNGICSEEKLDWISAYLDVIAEYEKEIYESKDGGSYDYGLIDINGDATPEFVVSTGMWIDVYTFDNDVLYPIIESWTYGAFGIPGYLYLPGENVIFSEDADLAGAVRYYSYLYINDEYEIDSIFKKAYSCWMFRDKNDNYMWDDGEEIGEDEAVYYCGNDEISEEEFKEGQIDGDYQMLIGDKNAKEMIGYLIDISNQ